MWAKPAQTKNPSLTNRGVSEMVSPPLSLCLHLCVLLLPWYDGIFNVWSGIVSGLVTQGTKTGKSHTGKLQWTHLPANLLCTGVPLAADPWEILLWLFSGAETPRLYSVWHTDSQAQEISAYAIHISHCMEKKINDGNEWYRTYVQNVILDRTVSTSLSVPAKIQLYKSALIFPSLPRLE